MMLGLFAVPCPLYYTRSMRVFLETLGCRLNYAEMTALGRKLEAAGYELASSADQADLCVLNTCAVTGEAGRQSRQLARHLARTNPTARLIVTGCYATLEEETVRTLPNVVLVVGNAQKDHLLALVEDLGREMTACVPRGGMDDARTFTAHSSSSISNSTRSSRTRAFVKVQDGCRNRCTFCIVTVARGDERSRSIPEVVEEVIALHRDGYREVVLTGVHLGAYGRDQGSGLPALIGELLAHTRIPRLRLSSLEPFDLIPQFFDLWGQSQGRLMPHLHLPAQSGSNRVLRRMARHYRAGDFEALVEAARTRIPGVTITTDMIAGFPGESESDFAETVAFARRVGFAHMHVFTYSARAGTPAVCFDGQVPESERRRRSQVLCDLDVELGRALRDSFVGQTRPVLWERSMRNAAQARVSDGDISIHRQGGIVLWSGLTDNYLRVRMVAPEDVDLHNRITATRLTKVAGVELLGEVVG
jgi:threonylcarbamoyladenosine tRNA methylthiotransferase MtaB